MVAITVIFVAVIGTFGFGMKIPDKAPYASIVVESTQLNGSIQRVTMIHQGGDSVNVSDIKIVTLVNNEPLKYQLDDLPRSVGIKGYNGAGGAIAKSTDPIWEAGEIGWYNIAKSTNRVLHAGDKVNVKIIYKTSGTIITSSYTTVIDKGS